MRWKEPITRDDAVAFIEMLCEVLNVPKPCLSFSGRKQERGMYKPRAKTIILHKTRTLLWIVAHEFAHYLDHVETGRNVGSHANDKEWHSQGFYYKLRKIIRIVDLPDYPWQSEYKQLARWAARDGYRSTTL